MLKRFGNNLPMIRSRIKGILICKQNSEFCSCHRQFSQLQNTSTNNKVFPIYIASVLQRLLSTSSSKAVDTGRSDIFLAHDHKRFPLEDDKVHEVEFSKKTYIEGLKIIKEECIKFKNEAVEHLKGDPKFVLPGDTEMLFDFDSDEAVKKWKAYADSDDGLGFSSCNFTRSIAGHGLFTGFIDLAVPDDGSVARSGFCNIGIHPDRKSFFRKQYFNWELYTHLKIRCRGDGRTYMLILSAARDIDLTWTDIYSYALHTRGGPYWQETTIPFSKLIFSARGRIQDFQSSMLLSEVSRLGITASGHEGPFRLEIDSISLYNDPEFTEECAYEQYTNVSPIL